MTDRLNWLKLTNEIQPAWDAIVKELSAPRVDAICSGRWYDLSHAAMANALNLAIDETSLSPRKKKRIGTGMLNIMFMVIPFVFMFGWMARGDDADKA